MGNESKRNRRSDKKHAIRISTIINELLNLRNLPLMVCAEGVGATNGVSKPRISTAPTCTALLLHLYLSTNVDGPHMQWLFALPNQNADHSTPECIRITEVGSFDEPLVPVETVLMQLVGARPSVLPSQINRCSEVVLLNAIVARIGNYRSG